MPRFGELLPADVWAASSRTLSAFAAQDLFDLPIIDAQYPGTTVSASASANTFGSWAELVANVGAGKRLIGVVILADVAASTTYWEMEFGEGAAGAEAAVARVEGAMQELSGVGRTPAVVFWLWKSLTSNARLSARVKANRAAAWGFPTVVLIA